MKKRFEKEMANLLTDNADDEVLTGENCQICGYPIVLEYGLEVCYKCGWSREESSANNI